MTDDARSELAARGIELLETMFYGGDGYPGFVEELTSPDLSELTLSQMSTLLYLHAGPVRMGSLATRLHAGLSSTTSIAKRLERRGLVVRRRDSADGRAVLCSLSDEGRRRIDGLFAQRRVAIESRLQGMDIGELGTVAHALELMARTMPGEAGSPDLA